MGMCCRSHHGLAESMLLVEAPCIDIVVRDMEVDRCCPGVTCRGDQPFEQCGANAEIPRAGSQRDLDQSPGCGGAIDIEAADIVAVVISIVHHDQTVGIGPGTAIMEMLEPELVSKKDALEIVGPRERREFLCPPGAIEIAQPVQIFGFGAANADAITESSGRRPQARSNN